jgi:hypothetical protein
VTPIQVHITGDNSTLVTGLITGGTGVLGVVLGSLLSTVREGTVHKRRARARRRHAARVLWDELTWINTALEQIIETGDVSSWDADASEVGALWLEQRDELADAPLDVWLALEVVFRDLRQNDLGVIRDQPPSKERDDKAKQKAKNTSRRLGRAKEQLRPYIE